jgi:hypothetical protein
MRKLTLEYLDVRAKALEVGDKCTLNAIMGLQEEAMESALRIKALEDALTSALESISIITNTVIK